MRRALVLLAAAAASCGAVTPSSSSDAGGVDVGGRLLEAGNTDLQVDQVAQLLEAGNTDELEAAAPNCSSAADGCAACASSSSVDGGAPYSSAAQCKMVIDCVVGGGQTTYPLQSCHNLAGGGADYGGLFCVQALLTKFCPDVAR